MEASLVHGEGDFFGEPFKLTDPQRRFLDRLYRYDRRTGNRLVRRALLGRAKGWGKTELLAAIGLVELAGPPEVCPLSPNIPVGAASFEQADLLFGTARIMVTEGPLRNWIDAYDTEMLRKDGPGRMYRVAAAQGTNDGGRPTCFIADELHEWTGAKERVHLILSNSLAKRRNGLELNITTAGFDLDTLLGRLYQYGQQVTAGAVKDPGFLFDWLEADAGLDLSDPDQLRAAVLQANEHAESWDLTDGLLRRYAEIPQHEYRRYHLNQWTRAEGGWLTDAPGAWEDSKGEAALAPGDACWVGIDGALNNDSVAVVVVSPDVAGRFRVQSRIWTLQGNRIDYEGVKAHLRELQRRYSVVEFAYDPRFFEVFSQLLADEGLPMVEFPQSAERMAPACRNAYELIVDGRIVHDGDPELADHVLSAEKRQGERGWTLSKGKSRRKIDACIATVMALYRACQRVEDTASVYETRGLVTL